MIIYDYIYICMYVVKCCKCANDITYYYSHCAYTQEWNPYFYSQAILLAAKSGGNFTAGTNEGV